MSEQSEERNAKVAIVCSFSKGLHCKMMIDGLGSALSVTLFPRKLKSFTTTLI
jgi:hypothetical protein